MAEKRDYRVTCILESEVGGMWLKKTVNVMVRAAGHSEAEPLARARLEEWLGDRPIGVRHTVAKVERVLLLDFRENS